MLLLKKDILVYFHSFNSTYLFVIYILIPLNIQHMQKRSNVFLFQDFHHIILFLI